MYIDDARIHIETQERGTPSVEQGIHRRDTIARLSRYYQVNHLT